MTSYLFAWLLFLGLALGAMANLMLHNLTGGAWGVALRPALAAAARLVPLGALLGIPVIVGMRELYPIADHGWFDPRFFAARSVAYLAIWSALALLVRRSEAFSAIGLIVYVFTVSLAATDWVAALVPEWYSSALGLVVAAGQMLGAMALAVAHAGLGAPRGERGGGIYIDFGNLLLMYVMTWAYLAFMQFLIVWAGNLPREIAWYLPRLQTGWVAIGVTLVVFHFFAPLGLLLFRGMKRAPLLLGCLAAVLLFMHALDVYWLVAPSVRTHVAWGDPVALAAAAALWWFAWRPARA
jgi:hypothetical protein